MRTTIGILVSVAVAAAAWLAHTREAEACGGCFSGETVTTVDSHRMAISLEIERTVLWDQIRYTGDPEDFVWVLPVPTPDAQLELADPVFFDDLERITQPRILAPPLPPSPDCGPSGGAGGLDAAPSAADAGGVDVHREETVGPYEIVVIGSEDPDALHTWLTDHGYNVPAENLPVMAHYIDIGSEFIVMRLAPEQGVSAMQPVRVVYPGYMATFPLEMVKVGAYNTLDLTLWVIAEQRYAAHNYGTVTIDEADLVWDFALNRSNYTDLFRQAIDDAGGKAWVAEFAQPMDGLWFEAVEEADFATGSIRYPFLTRLRTDLLVDHIDEDLLLAPAADATPISATLTAQNAVNEPEPFDCPDDTGPMGPGSGNTPWNGLGEGGCGCRTGSSGTAPWGALALLGLVALVRRRSIRTR